MHAMVFSRRSGLLYKTRDHLEVNFFVPIRDNLPDEVENLVKNTLVGALELALFNETTRNDTDPERLMTCADYRLNSREFQCDPGKYVNNWLPSRKFSALSDLKLDNSLKAHCEFRALTGTRHDCNYWCGKKDKRCVRAQAYKKQRSRSNLREDKKLKRCVLSPTPATSSKRGCDIKGILIFLFDRKIYQITPEPIKNATRALSMTFSWLFKKPQKT